MTLYELLDGFIDITGEESQQAKACQVTGLCLDSRKLEKNNLFIALAGSQQHGLMHLGQVLKKGASAVIFDPANGGNNCIENRAEKVTIPLIAHPHLGEILGSLAARYYGDPSQQVSVIGVTGTNGKTSCSQFLSQLLDDCGVIGTLGWGSFDNLQKTANTTPDALALQMMMAEMAKQHKKTVALEVSSHGLAQGRVNGIHFKGAVYTNLSRDHLDYHGTMEAYLQTKLALFARPELAFAVINLDDRHSAEVLSSVPDKVAIWGFSQCKKLTSRGETLHADEMQYVKGGIRTRVHWRQHSARVLLPLYGDYNVANALAVLGSALALNVPFETAVGKLAQLKPIKGRMEHFGEAGQPTVFVDYAHSPDALEKVLSSLRQHTSGTLWLVFGCGGNRDAGKRPEMGKIAAHWADHIVITDDNPRFEKSEEIISQIRAGCPTNKVQVIADRQQAIEYAIKHATPDDCVLVAGKGHEDYQEIKGILHPFSDRETVTKCLRQNLENV